MKLTAVEAIRRFYEARDVWRATITPAAWTRWELAHAEMNVAIRDEYLERPRLPSYDAAVVLRHTMAPEMASLAHRMLDELTVLSTVVETFDEDAGDPSGWIDVCECFDALDDIAGDIAGETIVGGVDVRLARARARSVEIQRRQDSKDDPRCDDRATTEQPFRDVPRLLLATPSDRSDGGCTRCLEGPSGGGRSRRPRARGANAVGARSVRGGLEARVAARR
jgi:hypothetical protein